jgi:hypothetical protein
MRIARARESLRSGKGMRIEEITVVYELSGEGEIREIPKSLSFINAAILSLNPFFVS